MQYLAAVIIPDYQYEAFNTNAGLSKQIWKELMKLTISTYIALHLQNTHVQMWKKKGKYFANGNENYAKITNDSALRSSELFIFAQSFSPRYEWTFPRGRLESYEKFDGNARWPVVARTCVSIDVSIARARPVFMLMCACQPWTNRVHVLLRYIVSRHTPGRRMAAPYAPVWPKGSGWTTLPPHNDFVFRLLSLLLSLSSSFPFISHHNSQYFSPPRSRVSIDNPRENHDVLCRSASFPKLGPRNGPDVDTTRGQAIWRRGFAISMTRGWRIPGIKSGLAPPPIFVNIRRLNTYFFSLYRDKNLFSASTRSMENSFVSGAAV